MEQLRWSLLLLGLTVSLPACLAADAPAAKPPVTPIKAPKVVVKINPKDGATMVWITAGKFLMGSTDAQIEALCKANPSYKKDWFFGEKPQHSLYLDGFWMYKNDVTVAQYNKFCAATAREMRPAPSWGWIDDHPVVDVTWDDAKAYAAWAGVTLPTEAQWEKAAHGADGLIYPWGNEWDAEKCNNWLAKHFLHKTSPVESYPSGASPYGCMDMAGNVWQWCADWYDKNYYKNSPIQNPTGPTTGTARVLRGGSWYSNDSRYYRATDRDCYNPLTRYVDIGFRCAVCSPGP